jgi:hypothetical protein
MTLPYDMTCPVCMKDMTQQHIYGGNYEYSCSCGYVLDVNENKLYQGEENIEL